MHTRNSQRLQIFYGMLVLLWSGILTSGTSGQTVEKTKGAVKSPAAWVRHTIDNSSRGADGVRPADINGDGHIDLVTGWEEGGVIRVYQNPGPQRAKQPWPAVTVGRVHSPEDAVFADIDKDGHMDVVSSCEGKQRTMFFHWGPKSARDRLTANAWQTETLIASEQAAMWMFCLPTDVDGQHGVDLVTGSKGKGAAVGWFQSPANPRNSHAWKWHKIVDAGWIMSLVAHDVDNDGQTDIVFSDRKGPRRGIWWAKRTQTGTDDQKNARVTWDVKSIGGHDREVMFLMIADLDGDGRQDITTAVKGAGLLHFRRTATKQPAWQTMEIPLPPDTGSGKGVAVGDMDGDGRNDLVFSCEHSERKHGLMWLKSPAASGKVTRATNWQAFPVSGRTDGIKFDLVELQDLDGDGDLDILTCEERQNLGVIWYENPTRGKTSE